jgi:hypothetical protein
MATLVWTSDHKFPLDLLQSPLRCPNCGQQRLTVYFEVPGEPKGAYGQGGRVRGEPGAPFVGVITIGGYENADSGCVGCWIYCCTHRDIR